VIARRPWGKPYAAGTAKRCVPPERAEGHVDELKEGETWVEPARAFRDVRSRGMVAFPQNLTLERRGRRLRNKTRDQILEQFLERIKELIKGPVKNIRP